MVSYSPRAPRKDRSTLQLYLPTSSSDGVFHLQAEFFSTTARVEMPSDASAWTYLDEIKSPHYLRCVYVMLPWAVCTNYIQQYVRTAPFFVEKICSENRPKRVCYYLDCSLRVQHPSYRTSSWPAFSPRAQGGDDHFLE